MQPTTLLKPMHLAPGDTIAVISPAAPTPDAEQAFESGKKLFNDLGYSLRIFPNASQKASYLAGTDEQRLADLHAAFADPSVKAILCARGGYGCMCLLPHIDYKLIAQNPKIFIGFSDVTALHTAFYQKTGLVGFYGPMLTSNLIQNEPFSLENLINIITENNTLPFLIPNLDKYHCFQPGNAQGPLIGGNLSLLTALCGTPYQPKTKGHILFIEDWKEKYYSLDRQFQQLRLA
jgi:muramoyltetrapeptide carboxypeptidase